MLLSICLYLLGIPSWKSCAKALHAGEIRWIGSYSHESVSPFWSQSFYLLIFNHIVPPWLNHLFRCPTYNLVCQFFQKSEAVIILFSWLEEITETKFCFHFGFDYFHFYTHNCFCPYRHQCQHLYCNLISVVEFATLSCPPVVTALLPSPVQEVYWILPLKVES